MLLDNQPPVASRRKEAKEEAEHDRGGQRGIKLPVRLPLFKQSRHLPGNLFQASVNLLLLFQQVLPQFQIAIEREQKFQPLAHPFVEALKNGFQPLTDAALSSRHLGDHAEKCLQFALKQGKDQLLLARKVQVNRPFGNAHAGGNLIH